jgi:hypothetical protein
MKTNEAKLFSMKTLCRIDDATVLIFKPIHFEMETHIIHCFSQESKRKK